MCACRDDLDGVQCHALSQHIVDATRERYFGASLAKVTMCARLKKRHTQEEVCDAASGGTVSLSRKSSHMQHS